MTHASHSSQRPGGEDIVSVPLFERYRPSHRLALAAYRQTVQAVWVACGLAALFIWAFWGHPQWLNWSVLGINTGLLMILHGARLLPRSSPHRLRAASFLACTRESWFGYLLFASQSLLMISLGSLLWFSLPAIGVPLNPALHTGFVAVILFVILRRFLNEWAHCHPSDTGFPWHDLIRWVTVMIVTVLVAIATSHSVRPLGHPITGDITVMIVIIWVIAAFVILCALIMLLDCLRRVNREE